MMGLPSGEVRIGGWWSGFSRAGVDATAGGRRPSRRASRRRRPPRGGGGPTSVVADSLSAATLCRACDFTSSLAASSSTVSASRSRCWAISAAICSGVRWSCVGSAMVVSLHRRGRDGVAPVSTLPAVAPRPTPSRPKGWRPCGAGLGRLGRRAWAPARRLPDVAGRIRDDDIAEVREKARIDDVISEYVTLKRAGGGSLKGLCPFHDEKTPSFNVNPARQFFHCFGCGEGGDVIAFLMKVDGLTFTETVERLGGEGRRAAASRGRRRRARTPPRPGARPPGRGAQGRPGVLRRAARRPPTPWSRGSSSHQRGFDQAAAEMFGVGFAPRDGEALTRHLRGRRFTDEESVAAGLVAHGRSHYDRFRGRLVWPIREANGDTIGFGARRIFDDDRIEAKYLNTSETAIYKKSQVLYGIDLARTAMKDAQQAVVVEGYTDVMACHLAGVRTAVASCGTAFGTDHARVLRRFMGDHDTTSGEVIFTFDGDSAGQKAAMKVLESDQVFASQTYVAVAPEGMDPCDLRLQGGRRGGARAGRQAPAALPLRPRQHPRPPRPRPCRRTRRRAARRRRAGGEHPRQDQGRLVLPRAGPHGRHGRRRGARGGAPRRQPARAHRRSGARRGPTTPPSSRSPSVRPCRACPTRASSSSASCSSWSSSTRPGSVARPRTSRPPTSPTPRSRACGRR